MCSKGRLGTWDSRSSMRSQGSWLQPHHILLTVALRVGEPSRRVVPIPASIMSARSVVPGG
jgi:hypothetical protein